MNKASRESKDDQKVTTSNISKLSELVVAFSMDFTRPPTAAYPKDPDWMPLLKRYGGFLEICCASAV